jgi:replication-associated recombination protein RarA
MNIEEKKVFPWPTELGYDFKEVLSALQKSIRRGLEDDALFWATELYRSDYAVHAWRRLVVISSEDVGEAEPYMIVKIKALQAEWKERIKDKEYGQDAPLYFIQAVLALVRAHKSREVDEAYIVYMEGPRMSRPMPDYAIDKHTERGRAMGRENVHFFSEGAKLENEKGVSKYAEKAKIIRK